MFIFGLIAFIAFYLIAGHFVYQNILKSEDDETFDRVIAYVAWFPICGFTLYQIGMERYKEKKESKSE